MTLAAATRLQVPHTVVSETADVLREYGRQGCEGLVLWIGQVDVSAGGTVAQVHQLLVPPQRSLQSEDGVGYFVSSDVLFALNRLLAERRLRLIAQVHSHPTDAYHSATDDRYAIVTTEGGFSIVVPDFGRDAEDATRWATYRLGPDGWDEVPTNEAVQVQVVEGG